jgi:hypothetical protein
VITPTAAGILALLDEFLPPAGGPGNHGLRNALTTKLEAGDYDGFISQVGALCCDRQQRGSASARNRLRR